MYECGQTFINKRNERNRVFDGFCVYLEFCPLIDNFYNEGSVLQPRPPEPRRGHDGSRSCTYMID